jgi:hypothetical protein
MPRKIVIPCAALLAAAACTSHTSTTTTSPPALGGPSSQSTAASASPAASSSPYAIDPANFVSTIDNPYLPFITGTTFFYEGTVEGEKQQDKVVVTNRAKTILGVPCVVVEDTVSGGGHVIETTEDYYAQDKQGNVWYLGEDTKELDEHGNVTSTEGTWEGGVDGAQPGIVMPGHPEVPASFRQEFLRGHAEDMFWIVSLSQRVSVPLGSFTDVILTLEWTPLEPNVIDRKYYAAGVGLVAELSASGPKETAELVSVSP